MCFCVNKNPLARPPVGRLGVGLTGTGGDLPPNPPQVKSDANMAEEKDIKPGWQNATKEKGTKGGRPPKQVKAEERITIRVTSFEKLAIGKKAEAVGLSSSEYCRRAALERHITPALTAEETEAYLTLKKFATDFARLRNAFKVGAPTLVEEIRQVIYKLNYELDYIRNGKQSKGS